jgi:hypothetical protein
MATTTALHSAPPRLSIVHRNPKHPKLKDDRIRRMSVGTLKKQLQICWVRFEKAAKNAMAAPLYTQRQNITRPGDRHDRGFNKWVAANIGLSLSTVNRWANDYAIEQGFKKAPPKSAALKPTSSQKTRGSKWQYDLHLLFTKKQGEQFDRAWDALGDEVASQLIFDTIVQRYEKAKAKVKKEAA